MRREHVEHGVEPIAHDLLVFVEREGTDPDVLLTVSVGKIERPALISVIPSFTR